MVFTSVSDICYYNGIKNFPALSMVTLFYEAAEGGKHIRQDQGLAQVAVHSRRKAFFYIFPEYIGGHGYYWNPLRGFR
jgi:hypothetical protein